MAQHAGFEDTVVIAEGSQGYYLVFRHVFFIIEGHAASDSVTTAEISGARASMSPMEVTLQSCRVSATEADDP